MNNFNFPPNLNPQLYAWIACIIGSALSENFNATELNSFANWLILVGQFIETNAAQKQLINSRNNNFQNYNYTQQCDIDFLINAVNNLQKELNNLKNK